MVLDPSLTSLKVYMLIKGSGTVMSSLLCDSVVGMLCFKVLVCLILSDWISVQVLKKPGVKMADKQPDAVLERDEVVWFIGYLNIILIIKDSKNLLHRTDRTVIFPFR